MQKLFLCDLPNEVLQNVVFHCHGQCHEAEQTTSNGMRALSMTAKRFRTLCEPCLFEALILTPNSDHVCDHLPAHITESDMLRYSPPLHLSRHLEKHASHVRWFRLRLHQRSAEGEPCAWIPTIVDYLKAFARIRVIEITFCLNDQIVDLCAATLQALRHTLRYVYLDLDDSPENLPPPSSSVSRNVFAKFLPNLPDGLLGLESFTWTLEENRSICPKQLTDFQHLAILELFIGINEPLSYLKTLYTNLPPSLRYLYVSADADLFFGDITYEVDLHESDEQIPARPNLDFTLIADASYESPRYDEMLEGPATFVRHVARLPVTEFRIDRSFRYQEIGEVDQPLIAEHTWAFALDRNLFGQVIGQCKTVQTLRYRLESDAFNWAVAPSTFQGDLKRIADAAIGQKKQLLFEIALQTREGPYKNFDQSEASLKWVCDYVSERRSDYGKWLSGVEQTGHSG